MRRTFKGEFLRGDTFVKFYGNDLDGNTLKFRICRYALGQFFSLPSNATKLDLIVSTRPLEHGYKVFQRRGSWIYTITLSNGKEENRMALSSVDDAIKKLRLPSKPFYIAMEA